MSTMQEVLQNRDSLILPTRGECCTYSYQLTHSNTGDFKRSGIAKNIN